MPEGPSLVILKEALLPFKGKKVIAVAGNTSIDKNRLLDQKIIDLKTWGKQLFICFKDFSVRIHLLMFGTYSINEKNDGRQLRLGLTFTKGEINFYTCAVKLFEEPLDELYDWSADVMSNVWSAANAPNKLKEIPDILICDALLNQEIFSGVGNIIKNEILFIQRIHPLSKVGAIPPRKLNALIKEARDYSFKFYEWKKAFELKKHWLAHTKKMCPRDHVPLTKKHLGKTKRRSFYCEECQVKY
jgi:endonuclease-8